MAEPGETHYVFMYFTSEIEMTSSRKLSIVEYFSSHSGYRCGYCGTEDTNFSHGMWAHTLTTQDYQVRLVVSYYKLLVRQGERLV